MPLVREHTERAAVEPDGRAAGPRSLAVPQRPYDGLVRAATGRTRKRPGEPGPAPHSVEDGA